MDTQIRRDILKDWHILVLDDEPDSLEVARLVLRFYGATIHTASNGKEGLEKLRSMLMPPRFIISDLSMPLMDGWAFLSALREDAVFKATPVIALTAHAMVGDRERGLEAGFNNYLTKPLSADTFMGDLLRLLNEIPEFATQLAS
jgi:CheY-like chemotaxis protein